MIGDAPDGPIRWRLHLDVPPAGVWQAVATDEGRAGFWAATEERDGVVRFVFPNGKAMEGRVLERAEPARFAVEYFGGVATFDLAPDDRGGTDLTLTHTGQRGPDWYETQAGWLNVLFPLKAALQYGIDLRNHDPRRTWDQGFVDG